MVIVVKGYGCTLEALGRELHKKGELICQVIIILFSIISIPQWRHVQASKRAPSVYLPVRRRRQIRRAFPSLNLGCSESMITILAELPQTGFESWGLSSLCLVEYLGTFLLSESTINQWKT